MKRILKFVVEVCRKILESC